MGDNRRLAYLEALGVDVYVRRSLEQPSEPETPAPAGELGGVAAGVVTSVAQVSPESVLDWEPLQQRVSACTRCALHATRTQTVFGVGNRHASWMFIGEAPGADEDKQGEPFVGRAGQLLNSMLGALGFNREDVYIANVLKCRPPGNRDPRPEESGAWRANMILMEDLVDGRRSLLKTERRAHSPDYVPADVFAGWQANAHGQK